MSKESPGNISILIIIIITCMPELDKNVTNSAMLSQSCELPCEVPADKPVTHSSINLLPFADFTEIAQTPHRDCPLPKHLTIGNNYYWSNIHKRKLLAQLDVRADPDGQGSFGEQSMIVNSCVVPNTWFKWVARILILKKVTNLEILQGFAVKARLAIQSP